MTSNCALNNIELSQMKNHKQMNDYFYENDFKQYRIGIYS
jgi:hypothetical protein